MKKILILLTIIFLTGCKKLEQHATTIIEEQENCVISINYPTTTEKKLNKNIKKYINKQKKNFKKNYCNKEKRQELNIDFQQNITNNYTNIAIKTSIENTKNIKTFIYKNNKKIYIDDILTNNDIDILLDKIKKEAKNQNINETIINDNINNINDIEFTFDENNITIYLNINKTIEIKIPLELFDLKIKIEKKQKTKNIYTYKEINKTIDIEKKVIALTFDDGPSKYTKKIIDLLNKYEANATFFILGNKVEIYEGTLKYLLDSGNEIGNHSLNHKWLTHVSEDELLNQVNTTQEIIKNTLNYTPKLFRPTYGDVNKTIREKINMDIILWNIDTLDWKYRNGNKIYEKAIKQIEDGKIILMHDTYEYTYKALEKLIPKLKEQGYQFVTVSELQEIKKIRGIK